MNRALTAAAVLVVSGCTQHYQHVELRAGDVARAREAVGILWPEICTRDGEVVGRVSDAKPIGDDPRGTPDDASRSTYRLGPRAAPGIDRTPSPLLISGAVVTVAGGIGLVAAGVNLFACAGPTGCQIPDWAGPTALAGLGTMVVGSVLLIIGGLYPDAGTTRRPHTITELGDGHVCAP